MPAVIAAKTPVEPSGIVYHPLIESQFMGPVCVFANQVAFWSCRGTVYLRAPRQHLEAGSNLLIEKKFIRARPAFPWECVVPVRAFDGPGLPGPRLAKPATSV